METFNFPLNTLIYTLIFFIPGILFRRFFYSNSFTPEFQKGNLFERTIWTIFSSIFCLFIFTFLSFIISRLFDITLLNNISFDKIYNFLIQLSENKFPLTINKIDLYNLFWLLIFIYLLSAFLGYIFQYVIIKFHIISTFLPPLRFRNKWYYLSLPLKENGIISNTGEKHFIYVDLLEKTNECNTLYSGLLHRFDLNENGEIDLIILRKVSKYIFIEKKEENCAKIQTLLKDNSENKLVLHRETNSSLSLKKMIPGKLMIFK